MVDDDKSFEGIFGFEYKGGDRTRIEVGIILAKLQEIAKDFLTVKGNIELLNAKYPDNKAAKSIEEALADLSIMESTIRNRDAICRVWEEAQTALKKAGYDFPNGISDYFPK